MRAHANHGATSSTEADKPDPSRPGVSGGRVRGAAAAVAFVLMWASGAIAVRIGLGDSDVPTFLALRAVGAAAVSWSVWLVVRDRLPRTRRDWWHIVAVAVLLQIGYQSCFFLALADRLPAGLLAVIVGVQPILTAMLSRASGAAPVWIGLLLGLSGLALSVSSALTVPSGYIGVLFAVGALLAITVGTLAQRRIRHVGTWASLAVESSLSSAVMLTIAVSINHGITLPSAGVFYLALGWMVVIVSVGATALLYMMVNRAEAVRVTSLFYCVPPVTGALDFLVLGTRLAPIELSGMGLVVVALILIQRQQP